MCKIFQYLFTVTKNLNYGNPSVSFVFVKCVYYGTAAKSTSFLKVYFFQKERKIEDKNWWIIVASWYYLNFTVVPNKFLISEASDGPKTSCCWVAYIEPSTKEFVYYFILFFYLKLCICSKLGYRFDFPTYCINV